MPLILTCSCGKKLKVGDDRAGKKVRCPQCGNVLAAPAGKQAQAAAAPKKAAPPAKEEESEDLGFEVWTMPGAHKTEENSINLLAVDEQAFVVGSFPDDELNDIKKDLEADGDADALQGAQFFSLKKTILEVGKDTLDLKLRKGSKSAKLAFESKEQKKDFLKVLKALPGPGWDVDEARTHTVGKAFAYLGGFVGVAAVTVLLYLGVMGGLITRAPVWIAAPINFTGPWIILAIGGFIGLVVILAWLGELTNVVRVYTPRTAGGDSA